MHADLYIYMSGIIHNADNNYAPGNGQRSHGSIIVLLDSFYKILQPSSFVCGIPYSLDFIFLHIGELTSHDWTIHTCYIRS